MEVLWFREVAAHVLWHTPELGSAIALDACASLQQPLWHTPELGSAIAVILVDSDTYGLWHTPELGSAIAA